MGLDASQVARLFADAVGADRVSEGEAAGDDYGHDEALSAAAVRPLAVVRPETTEQVAAVLRVADEHRIPVTARGAGTGLSGGCTPRPDGIVVSFERMDRIVEIDTENFMAVVEPGVRLDQLDAALAPLGLVYPVFPGEYSASLGGNVNTNAGGMRAVKYGVTRHHVVGLEAVLPTGEVIRCGGKVVKLSTGYDLTQLVVGSEGTLALVTQATLKLYPRLPHQSTVLAPFASLDEVTSAVPAVVRSGVGPLILEYIDMLTLAAATAFVGIDLGIPAEVKDTAAAYLVVALENTHADRLDADTHALATQLHELGAIDVYVLPPGAAAGLIDAREKAFWVGKANGADDIIDVVVPRASVPDFMRRVTEIASEHQAWIAGCGHAGDGNVHMAVFQRDAEARGRIMRELFAAGMALGGAISGEHGLGGQKAKYFLELEDPAKIALMRRIKAAFDPHGILNPGKVIGTDAAHDPDLDPAELHPVTDTEMNGARSLVRTLVASGVDTCFSNPGTSEMHFVAALDDVPEMRAVLALFEGVATGAADGYARIAGKPAATLLHLGPGLGNGLANLHNARKGRVPIVNIVGDHASYHKRYDAQLESDIETVARNVSPWVRWSHTPADVGRDAAEAVAAAAGPPGEVATLILAADASWSPGGIVGDPIPPRGPDPVDADAVDAVAKALRSGEPCGFLLGGAALLAGGLVATSRVANATGARMLAETFPTRLQRGAGLPPIDRVAYLAEFAQHQLAGLAHLVVVDSKAPVSFFAYPGKASYLVPDGCEVHELAGHGGEAIAALEALADVIGAPSDGATRQPAAVPDLPTGELNAQAVAQAVAALLPEGAIVSDEANTSSLFTPGMTAGAPPHDWLCLTGGAIGQGLPVATGAAVAAPDRKVLSLEADGSALYTIQALWTQARESLDVVTVVFNNRSYAVLNMELNRVGADEPGPKARDLLDLSRPDIDFVAIAEGLGVPATRATTAEEMSDQLARALHAPGPALIEAIVPSAI